MLTKKHVAWRILEPERKEKPTAVEHVTNCLGGRIDESRYVQTTTDLVGCLPAEEALCAGCACQIDRSRMANHCSAAHEHPPESGIPAEGI